MILTREQILLANNTSRTADPHGYKIISQFCDDIEAGRPPNSKTLKSLASAFKILIADNDENLAERRAAFMKELDLIKKKSPGSDPASAKDEDDKIIAAYQYKKLYKEIKTAKEFGGGSKFEFYKDAAAEIAKNYKGKRTGITAKTVQDWAVKYKSQVRFIESITQKLQS